MGNNTGSGGKAQITKNKLQRAMSGKIVQPSNKEATVNIEIQSHMVEEQQNKMRNTLKLLVMGDYGSGKTTIFNQLRCIYGRGFTQYDQRTLCREIRQNLVTAILALLQQSQYYFDTEKKDECMVDISDEETVNAIKTIVPHKYFKFNVEAEPITDWADIQNIGHAINYLWKLAPIQNTYNEYCNHCTNNVNHSSEHFLNLAELIFAEDYHPSTHDLLLHKSRQTSMIHRQFRIPDISMTYHVCEIGRNSNIFRVLNIFSPIDIILFLVPLSSYCQPTPVLFNSTFKHRSSATHSMSFKYNNTMTNIHNNHSHSHANANANANANGNGNTIVYNLSPLSEDNENNNNNSHHNNENMDAPEKANRKYILLQILYDFQRLIAADSTEIQGAHIMVLFTKDDVFRGLIRKGIPLSTCFNEDCDMLYDGLEYTPASEPNPNNDDNNDNNDNHANPATDPNPTTNANNSSNVNNIKNNNNDGNAAAVEEEDNEMKYSESADIYEHDADFMKCYNSAIDFIKNVFIQKCRANSTKERKLFIDVMTTINKAHVVRVFQQSVLNSMADKGDV